VAKKELQYNISMKEIKKGDWIEISYSLGLPRETLSYIYTYTNNMNNTIKPLGNGDFEVLKDAPSTAKQEECKVIMFSERGIEVWDGVNDVEKYYIEWEEIDSVKKLGEEG
jgi:hypothetical protein